jgi:hypothetical protein
VEVSEAAEGEGKGEGGERETVSDWSIESWPQVRINFEQWKDSK